MVTVLAENGKFELPHSPENLPMSKNVACEQGLETWQAKASLAYCRKGFASVTSFVGLQLGQYLECPVRS